MSTHRWFDRICVIVIALCLVITVLFMNGEKLGIALVTDADSEAHSDSEWFTDNDMNGNWDTSGATFITLSGTSISISGNGAYVRNGNLYIVQSGKYVLSGNLEGGSVIVDAQQYSKVWILLNGVQISCDTDACLRVDQADKVFLTLAEGTENAMTGGSDYTQEAIEDGTNAVIYAHDDLTINGSGSLTVSSSYLNGITAKDDLVITGGTLTVTAHHHGIKVNDSLRITGVSMTVTAEEDGLHAGAEIVIQDGNVVITAGDDAIHSDTAVYVYGGEITIADCYEGIEATIVEIAGGDTLIYARDDGVNANGNTGISFDNRTGGPGKMKGGADMTMPEDGITPDSSAMGTPPAMADGATLDFSAMGTPPVGEDGTAPDFSAMGTPPPMADGVTPDFSAMGTPSDLPENGFGGMMESDGETASDKPIVSVDETYVLISGGTLTIINATGNDADGIDSNGSILITGGSVLISLTDGATNNALDYGSESGGACIIHGGNVIACGSSGMVEEISEQSTQCSIMYNLSESVTAGQTVALRDAEGSTLLTWEVPNSFSSVTLSCPEMTIGETYTIQLGDSQEDVTLDSVAATLGESSSGMTGFNMNEPPNQGEDNQPPEGWDGSAPSKMNSTAEEGSGEE